MEHRLVGRHSGSSGQYLRFSGVEHELGSVGGLGTLLGPEGAGK